MSYPPWPDWTAEQWHNAVKLHSSAKFDEAKHPRDPAGTAEGGQFTETGHTGTPTSDPALVEQAKTGIAAVEKLIPEALQSLSPTVTEWNELDTLTRNEVYKKWIADTLATHSQMSDDDAAYQWEDMHDDEKLQITAEYLKQGAVQGTMFDRDRIVAQHPPQQWVTGITNVTGNEANDTDYALTHNLALRLTELRTDQLRKERGLLEPKDKPTYTIKDVTIDPDPVLHIPGASGFHVLNDQGEVVSTAYTKEQAELNAQSWVARELEAAKTPSHVMIEGIWRQWLHSSSEGTSLSLQLAIAKELGGHHRMAPDEIKTAEEEAERFGGIPTMQAYVRAQWEVTQMVLQKAGESEVQVYRGLMLAGSDVKQTSHQVFFRNGKPVPEPKITFEGINPATGKHSVQFEYAGEKFAAELERIPVGNTQIKDIRDIPPGGFTFRDETVEEAVHTRIQRWLTGPANPDLFTKLPDLPLKRAGAQSTTGTRDVANSWGGVGDLPPDPTRVVLRIDAPATSVISLPVYGRNTQHEHEVVVAGTKDHWLWDAWMGKAPSYESRAIGHTPSQKTGVAMQWGKPVDYDEMSLKSDNPLVIDLQAEDRGKPHWLSGLQSVAKFDEAQHPRDKEGQFTTGVGEAARLYATTYEGARNVQLASDYLLKGQSIPDSARGLLAPIPSGIGKKHEEAAEILVGAIRSAPEHSKTLYRGLGGDYKIKSLENAKVGDVLTLGQISSFTESRQIAAYYANRQSLSGDYYELKTEGPIKSVPTDGYTGLEHREHLTEGKFEVVGIDEPKTGVLVLVENVPGVNRKFYVTHNRSITLRQVGVF